MKNYKFIFLLLLVVVCLAGQSFMWLHREKAGYLDLGILFSNFQMKKEMEAKLENTQHQKELILDSLEIQLNILSKKTQTNTSDKELVKAFELQRQEYLMKKQSFEKEGEYSTQQFNNQIWKQINQYVKDFGDEYHYSYIYGAEGSGGVMYGSADKNITDLVKDYINKKYKGIK
jgi:outer membrane protein